MGLEMEGTHYLREVVKGQNLGVVRPNLPLRILYYVSDVPLAAGSTLSGRLAVQEGIPPLYAVTREILTGILGDAAQ